MKPSTTNRHLVILGATSGMAQETARLLASLGNHLLLVGRNEKRLELIAKDIDCRGSGKVKTRLADLEQLGNAHAFMDELREQLGGLDGVLLFHGYLGDQKCATTNQNEMERIISANFSSAASLSLAAFQALLTSSHNKPVLLAIGSVAGDRGRASNNVYGACKGAMATLYQGLIHEAGQQRNRLSVVLIKAGLTDSPMTASIPKSGPLWTSTQTMAQIIVQSLDRGSTIRYAPGYWRIIMFVIRLMPQTLMNRLAL